jgi:hypothetical protein
MQYCHNGTCVFLIELFSQPSIDLDYFLFLFKTFKKVCEKKTKKISTKIGWRRKETAEIQSVHTNKNDCSMLFCPKRIYTSRVWQNKGTKGDI